MHDAVDRDDLPLVKSLLDARYSVNMRDSHGEPPLRCVHSLSALACCCGAVALRLNSELIGTRYALTARSDSTTSESPALLPDRSDREPPSIQRPLCSWPM